MKIEILTESILVDGVEYVKKEKEYYYEWDLHCWLSRVEKWWKWWYVDKDRKIVIPLVYDDVCKFGKWISVVKKWDKYGIINKKWKVMMDFIYTDYYYHSNNDISVIKDWIEYKITTI
jgi:hypothetical protein